MSNTFSPRSVFPMAPTQNAELEQAIRLLRSWLVIVEDVQSMSREEALRYLTSKLHFLVDYLENA